MKDDQEFIGYAPAGAYLGLKPTTLSSYVTIGIGPEIHRRQQDRGYSRPVFLKSELDSWNSTRPGRGARVDLRKS